nr:EAL domain-containing protein [Solimonas variicoloris]
MGAGRELFGVRKDGSRLPIEVGLDVLRSGSDVMVLASIFDASERHAARQRADEASALAQSIIDSAAFPIIATDIDGRVLEFSPSAERVLRLRKADLLGQRLPIVVREQAGSAVPLIELDDSAEPGPARGRRGAMPFGNGEMREYVWRCADGTRVPIHLAVSGLRNRSGTLFGYIAILYDLSERKRYEEHMRIIAEQDALTGLPNRLVLHERLAAAIGAVEREGGQVGVLLIDLDNFKRVNDSLGHYMGDKLLGLVAARLRSCIRVNDMVARMGGDEFVVVLAGIRRPIIAQLVARKIVRELCRPLELDGHTVEISPSIGICLYPTDAVTVDDLIKNADTAMYAAKEAGRGRFMPFSHEMADAASERWRIEHAMRLAMGRNEFCVAYQPQVDLRSARVTGVEALLRWPGVDGATTSPAHFIPVAEQTGLIAPIGEWVLRTACREISQLDADGVPGLRLSINLSPRQLRESNMIEIVSDTLADNNFDPERLELEITESAFVDDDVAHAIMQLHELGVRVAIDDFGTGYSSLSQVTRFPLDRLKIDRVFVQDVAAGMRHAAVTAAIIAMGRHMGIDVVAEGIETEAQARALREQGCQEGQGFLYSQAVPIGELAEAIHRIESRG